MQGNKCRDKRRCTEYATSRKNKTAAVTANLGVQGSPRVPSRRGMRPLQRRAAAVAPCALLCL